jgi:hypothetical protein
MLNTFPFNPTRFCLKMAGPCDVIFMSTNAINDIGKKTIKPVTPPNMSTIRFTFDSYIDVFF